MNPVERIAIALAARPARIIEPGDRVVSAVALIVRETATGLEVLFIERSRAENDRWSGHLAFPGGKYESSDKDLRQTAERETEEELGIGLSSARYLGRLDDIAPPGLPVVVSCFVYAVGQRPLLRLNHDEIADAFWFPLGGICDPSRHTRVTSPGRRRTRSFPALRLLSGDKPPLWGISYRLLRNLNKLLKEGASETIIMAGKP